MNKPLPPPDFAQIDSMKELMSRRSDKRKEQQPIDHQDRRKGDRRGKPKPSSLGQQIKDAKKEWAKLTPEQQNAVKLQGSSEHQRTEPYYGQGTACDFY